MIVLTQKGERMSKTKYDYEYEFEELMDSALNELSPKSFSGLVDSISMMLEDYTEEDEDGSDR